MDDECTTCLVSELGSCHNVSTERSEEVRSVVLVNVSGLSTLETFIVLPIKTLPTQTMEFQRCVYFRVVRLKLKSVVGVVRRYVPNARVHVFDLMSRSQSHFLPECQCLTRS